MAEISRPLAVALLVGTALLGIGAALHPMLPADVPGQLRMIAAAPTFRAAHLATAYVAGQRELAPLFEALHRFGLLAARFGNFLVALGALVLGFVERADAESPGWMAWLAWIAAAGGLAGVVLVPEASLLMLTAVTLISGWSVGTSVLALRGMRQ